MSTLQAVELGVLGPLQVRRDGAPVLIPGAKPRTVLIMLGLHGGSVVSADMLLELLWGDDPPRTAAKALQTHISSLRRALGDGFVLTEGTGWILNPPETDASRYKQVTRMGRDAASAGDTAQAVARFEEALSLWRGTPELPDNRRGISEKTRWIESHAALVEDRADALLATGRAAEIIGELEAAVADAPLRERRWGQLMLALYRAGRQGEALAAFRRARSLLADELGVDPGTELRRLEAAMVAQDAALDTPVLQQVSAVMRAVTFLLTDIEGSTAAWEADSDAMAVALARHDELVEQVVTSRGGRLIKTRGEGDATFSVFDRPSAAAAAALELQDAILHEPWALRPPLRVRVALHTGEVELRDGDYFGRAVNRAARLRSLAEGAQILCSGATAELVIDSLPDDVVLADLGIRHLKNLARPEHVFELRLDVTEAGPQTQPVDDAFERPALPAVLTGPGPFVGRVQELEQLLSAWQTALSGGTRAVLIAGEPGVGKTRLGGEWSQQAYRQGAVVLYGRCDEDLGAPYQPFAEALRSLVPCIGARRLRALRGVEALLSLVPALTDVLPDLAAPTRADPDTERYALFDVVVAVLEAASASAPVVLILDDLHWAAKPTLLLLRHLLRFGDHARVQIVGTYRSTDLDRSHPLAAMLADLHRDGTAERINLSGLDGRDVTAYVAESGYDDEDLADALASVTGGNPFFLIEALRHVEESGGTWDQSTLPQGVREAVSRRLSRLPVETNKALAAAAVVGSRFAVELVEQVVEDDLMDAFDQACKAGIIIEEPGGRYRFNHAIVRQSLLAELASVRRMRLHQRIATTLEAQSRSDSELLAELAHHYFECAWAGNAAKAVEYCRRAADQAMTRLAYEGAADLYDRALHAMEELDDELPGRDDQTAELLVARCEALLAAGDVTSAPEAVSQLRTATVDSARLAAWATCFDGQLSMLIHPERLDEVEAALSAAAEELAGLDDAAGEATAHTVRASCLARLGRIGDCEVALDEALTAARRAREHRRVNAVLAGAPLAALWGPNPVPRAGGRCLDVVRLLRITTDSPAVEATSTRCQAVLEAFRGRAAAARRMIDSARRTVTELGLRHALMEVEQFAGIVELVADDPAAAEPHLRKAYNGFRRMGLDADTAETAALLGRACLALDRDSDADELCLESERLAGHALKPSIAWRVLRAHLLSRSESHGEARIVAEAAVALAERTDALVDHGDACLSLATILGAAGDVAGARAAAERAADLYERKGAAALAERARLVLGERDVSSAPVPPEAPSVELDNAAARASKRVITAIHRDAWDEVGELYAPEFLVESRRKIVGFTHISSADWAHQIRRALEAGAVRFNQAVIAVRGEHLALTRLVVGSTDASPGAPRDEFLSLDGIDSEGRISLTVWFDLDDMDAAMAELDALYVPSNHAAPRQERRLENAATLVFTRFWSRSAARDWDGLAELVAEGFSGTDHRRAVNGGSERGRDRVIESLRVSGDIGFTLRMVGVTATRGARLALTRVRGSGPDPEAIQDDALNIVEIDADERIVSIAVFDLDDFDSAIAELDARYIAGEAAAHAQRWSVVTEIYAGLNRHELPVTAPDWVNVDRRHVTKMAPGDMITNLSASWDLTPKDRIYIEAVHRLHDQGIVVTHSLSGTSHEGFVAEWRMVNLLMFEGDLINRSELFDEADLDAAIARFDQLSVSSSRLGNAASRVAEHFWECFTSRDWTSIATVLTDDVAVDDRRSTTNAGVRVGRDAEIEDLKTAASVGFTKLTPTVVATRGVRLVLSRTQATGQDPDAVCIEVFHVIETDAEEHIAALVVFEVDDFASAIEELDARYLAGEAASHAHVWSMIAESYVVLRRQEFPAVSPDAVFVDHRRAAAFGSTDLPAYIRAGYDLGQHIWPYVVAVHRLSDLGAVCSHAAQGVSDQGFDAEWQGVNVTTVEGDMFYRCEFFDEADLDAAIARFDELSRPTPQLENAASQAYERIVACMAGRDWDAMAQDFADNYYLDDRRRGANAGVYRGRSAAVEDLRVSADIGLAYTMSGVMATRGERLALVRGRASVPDPGAIQHDAPLLIDVDADGRIAAVVVFDLEDFDTAIAELDARYLVGEAAAHAHTWSVITRAFAAANRNELPARTPDWVNVDHRRARAFEPGELESYMRATWDAIPDTKIYIESVHRLSNLGAVVTHAVRGTSRDGFDAEWREVSLSMVDGELFNRSELFDEPDLDAALARFDELHPRTLRLKNAVVERFLAHFAAHDWDAIAQDFAEDYYLDDRRRVVNSGLRQGRDAAVEDLRMAAEVGLLTNITSDIIATRGERRILTHWCASGPDPDAARLDVLQAIEIDDDERFAAVVVFDPDDIHAAFAELDTRYLSGEAAAHAQTWSAVTEAYGAVNRHEVPPTTPDWAMVDHRRIATTTFEAGDLAAFPAATWDLTSQATIHVETVHRLSDLGAVVTHSSRGISHDGLDAEWHDINLVTVDAGLVHRCEIFDEEDLDAALARFEELHPQTPRLKNAASRVWERFSARYVGRDWAAVTEILADDVFNDDRRRVVSAGVRHGRDATIESMRATAALGLSTITAIVLATRGERLVLSRELFSFGDQRSEAFSGEVLGIVEIDADERVVARLALELDDFDAAVAELDARYLAGEAAAHADMWSLIVDTHAAVNRRELPATTPDHVYIDHRPLVSVEGVDLAASLRALWDITAAFNVYVEAVHRLDDLGAVVTQMVNATTHEGVDAELRIVEMVTVEGGLLSRVEVFDEADLAAALARFDELHPRAPRLENAASRVHDRYMEYYRGRDWAAIAEILTDDSFVDDRHDVVNVGFWDGRDVVIANLQALAEAAPIPLTVIATRGERLVLSRMCSPNRDAQHGEFSSDMLIVAEIDTDERIAAQILFNTDDFDAATRELEARYRAGEAADHADTWSVMTQVCAALNRRELPTTTADFVDIDHRSVATIGPGDLMAYIRTALNDGDYNIYIEAVHRLSDLGAVVTLVSTGTSHEGFDGEWRMTDIFTVERDLIDRCEMFDETDLEAALARFDEIRREAHRTP